MWLPGGVFVGRGTSEQGPRWPASDGVGPREIHVRASGWARRASDERAVGAAKKSLLARPGQRLRVRKKRGAW